MGVIPSEAHYGIDTGLCFSYPCQVSPDGEWKIVDGLQNNDFSKGKIAANEKELQQERKMALGK